MFELTGQSCEKLWALHSPGPYTCWHVASTPPTKVLSFKVDQRNMRPNSPKWIQIHGTLSYSLWIMNHKWLLRVTLVLLRLFTMSTPVYATKSQLKVASIQLFVGNSNLWFHEWQGMPRHVTTSFTIQTPSLWSCWLNFCHLKQRNKQRYIHRKRFLKQQVPGMKTQNPGN